MTPIPGLFVPKWLRFRPDGTATFFLPVPSTLRNIDNTSDVVVELRLGLGLVIAVRWWGAGEGY